MASKGDLNRSEEGNKESTSYIYPVITDVIR